MTRMRGNSATISSGALSATASMYVWLGVLLVQIRPMRMKTPISIRAAVPRVATARKASIGDRCMARLAVLRSPRLNSPRQEMFRPALPDFQFFDRQSRNLCGVFDAGLRDIDYRLRDHFR